MKIIKQGKTGNKVIFNIEIEAAEFSKAYDKVIERTASQLRIPGFRPGKAPKNIIEQNIDTEAAKERALDIVVEDNYRSILMESKIEPVDFPKWSGLAMENGKDCFFSLEVEVMPEVKLGKYKGLKIDKTVKKVEESDIDAHIKSLQEESSHINPITDRPVKDGDIAELDIEGSVGGHIEEALSQRAFPILLGENRIAPGFDQKIVGMSLTQVKEFDITFPKDYYIKGFEEKTARFKVTLKRIAERVNPEFNDDFIKKISSLSTVEEYRKDLRARLEKAAGDSADFKMKDDLLEKISNESICEVPRGLQRKETDTMIGELSGRLAESGLSLENYLKNRKINEENLREEMSSAAKTRVKAKLVLRAIADEEKLIISEKELEEEIGELAKEGGKSPEEYLTNESARVFVEDYMLRKKALDFIVNNANIKS